MACPCEILLDATDAELLQQLTQLAQQEALRIEKKYSRYRDDNIIHRINTSPHAPVNVDNETSRLLDFADQCYQLSEGKFDITSGVLRQAWNFDTSDRLPEASQVDALLSRIGWQKISWHSPSIQLPSDMEIDLGGIGKEYAVDSTLKLLSSATDKSLLVNFGGDIACNGPRENNIPWVIGIDDPVDTGQKAAGQLKLYRGALATSGDSQRFLLKDGIRYSHILNPLTGWPVEGAPRSVSVIADTCLEAGMLATFAMLEGHSAKDFLEQQGVEYLLIK